MIGDTNASSLEAPLGQNVGSDTNPIKIVDGKAVAISNAIPNLSYLYFVDTLSSLGQLNDFGTHVLAPGIYAVSMTITYNGASNAHTDVIGIVVGGSENWLQSQYNTPAGDFTRYTATTIFKLDSASNFNVRLFLSNWAGIVNLRVVQNLIKIA